MSTFRSMRKNGSAWLAAFVLVSLSACNTGPAVVNQALTGVVAKEILDDLSEKVELHIGQATSGADFALEKAAAEAKLLLQDAQYRIDNSIDRVFERLSAENQKLLDTAQKVVASLDDGMGRIEDLEDLLAIDVSNSINRLWFVSDEYFLRRIKGWAIPYRSTGRYEVELIGGALGPDYWARVHWAGHEIPSQDLRATRAGFLTVQVDAQKLNDKFSDTAPARVPLELECGRVGDDDVLYAYSGSLVLMPRFPYQYKLVEHHTEKYWSGKQDGFVWGPQSFIAGPGGRVRGEDPHVNGSASVAVPGGHRVIASSFRHEMDGGGWGRFYEGSQEVTGGGTGMRGRFKNWIREGQRVRVGVGYEAQLERLAKTELQFTNMQQGQIPALPFGASQAQLLPGYQSFTLSLTSFTGKTLNFTPGQMVKDNVELTLENKPNFKRLIVNVKAPQ